MKISIIKESFTALSKTFKEIRRHKEVLKFLIARLVYNDGLITIFAFGGIYAKEVFQFTFNEILLFGIVLNVTAGLGAFLLGFVDDVIGDLGSKDHLSAIANIIENGSSADRQLKIFNETNDLKLVVDHLIKETSPDYH